MKTNKNSYLRLFTILSAVTLLFSSCLKDLSNQEPQEVSALNVINASPGDLSINFFLDNGLVNVPSLSYGQESTYVLANSGSRKFDVAASGTFDSLVADTISVETDKFYSLFVTGKNDSLSTFLAEDDLSLPESGKAKIRFINLSPDGGPLALTVKNGNGSLFPGQAYKTASAFTTIDPTTYTFELKNPNPDASIIREASLDVVAGKIYTIWAGGLKDNVDNTGLGLFLQVNNNN